MSPPQLFLGTDIRTLKPKTQSVRPLAAAKLLVCDRLWKGLAETRCFSVEIASDKNMCPPSSQLHRRCKLVQSTA